MYTTSSYCPRVRNVLCYNWFGVIHGSPVRSELIFETTLHAKSNREHQVDEKNDSAHHRHKTGGAQQIQPIECVKDIRLLSLNMFITTGNNMCDLRNIKTKRSAAYTKPKLIDNKQ